MLLPLTMKVGKVGHGQHCWAATRRPTEQRGFQPVIVPLRPKRPRDLGSFGPLQVLMCGAEANRATAGDLPQPQAHFKFQSKNFLILRTDNLLAGKLILPFEGRLPAIVLSSAAISLWKSFRRSRTPFRDRPETVRLHRGTGVRLHRGTLFEINPEHRSASSRNRVHLAPDSPTSDPGPPKVAQIGSGANSGEMRHRLRSAVLLLSMRSGSECSVPQF